MRRLVVATISACFLATPTVAQTAKQLESIRALALLGYARENCLGQLVEPNSPRLTPLFEPILNLPNWAGLVDQAAAELAKTADESGPHAVCETVMKSFGPNGTTLPGLWLTQ